MVSSFNQKIKTTKRLPSGEVIDISYMLDDYIKGKKILRGEIFPLNLHERSNEDYVKVAVTRGDCYTAKKIFKGEDGLYYMTIENPTLCNYYNIHKDNPEMLYFKNRLIFDERTGMYELIAIDLINISEKKGGDII